MFRDAGWLPPRDAGRAGPLRYQDGHWDDVGRRRSQWPVVDFGFGFGRRRTIPMEFDELYPLPERMPGLRELGFSITMDTATNLVSALIVPALGLTGPRPWAIKTCSHLFSWTNRVFARPPYGCVVTVEAAGVRTGAPVTLRLRVFHEDAYELTAMAGASMTEQLLDGSARSVGLHRMGLIVDPQVLLRDLAAMGARVET